MKVSCSITVGSNHEPSDSISVGSLPKLAMMTHYHRPFLAKINSDVS